MLGLGRRWNEILFLRRRRSAAYRIYYRSTSATHILMEYFFAMGLVLTFVCCDRMYCFLHRKSVYLPSRPLKLARDGSTDRRDLPSSNFCTLVCSSCETKFSRVILHYNTNKRPSSYFFFVFSGRGVQCTLFWGFFAQLTLEQKQNNKDRERVC